MLLRVLKHKEAVMCFRDKIHELEKLCSNMSYRAADHRVKVNKSIMHTK